MLKFAKSIEDLSNAPYEIREAMIDWLDYFNFASELRNNINERFNYPSLWAALDQLLEFTEKRDKALCKFKASGYTCDDAFAWRKYEREG